ncbi:MAG: glycosyltransferase family 2 protein [Acidiferrobacterales bacterium]
MGGFVSIIIPNYQGDATIGRCLEAAFASRYRNFEVIVVDDCSRDNSIEVIKRFPCKLVRLQSHAGAAQARNIGATHSSGDILFFTDADCLLQENTLAIVSPAISSAGPNTVIGGTYTRIPFDASFFSLFQSVFVNYSETKKMEHPDYIATHAMAIDAESFRKSGGFSEKFLPILEDVDFSHRLREHGYRLVMDPAIKVQHIFHFSLYRSLRNAIRKSMYWTMYSMKYGDVFADSGTASTGLKTNVAAWFFAVLFLLAFNLIGNGVFMLFIPLVLAINLFVNRGLLMAFYRTKGALFAIAATGYYLLLYPVAVGTGALAGLARHLVVTRTLRENT